MQPLWREISIRWLCLHEGFAFLRCSPSGAFLPTGGPPSPTCAGFGVCRHRVRLGTGADMLCSSCAVIKPEQLRSCLELEGLPLVPPPSLAGGLRRRGCC